MGSQTTFQSLLSAMKKTVDKQLYNRKKNNLDMSRKKRTYITLFSLNCVISVFTPKDRQGEMYFGSNT